ncbi:phosphatase inhibitor-domain-containing protein [Lipomyces arxii]|uniref:phosphatase inhibitor-domain-containing protein n=1 Tax=Lipomyces arxii TaxID=56418 RepID=UPI0034CEDDC7
MQRQRESARPSMGPSVVIEEVNTPTLPGEQPPVAVLRLRGGPISSRRVTWNDDVVDNEFMDKKKSKLCCIFHKQRAFDESSSDESSSSDSSGSDSDGAEKYHEHDYNHDENGQNEKCNHSHSHSHRRKKPSPNAYEKQPKYKKQQSKTLNS